MSRWGHNFSSYKILVSPVEIAGYYSGLVLGLKELGASVDLVTRDTHRFGYATHSSTPIAVKINRILRERSRVTKRNGAYRLLLAAIGEIFWICWALGAIFRYRVFIFGFGQSLFRWNLDLPLLRLLGKRVVINLSHGSEARPPYMDGAIEFDLSRLKGVAELKKQTRRRQRAVSVCERYAGVVIGAPFSTSQFARKPFVNVFALGWPVVMSDLKAHPEPSTQPSTQYDGDRNSLKCVVVHAPSNPKAKGTDQIGRVVAELSESKYELELLEVHGQPNAAVREAILVARFVVDQLYSDTPLAGFASEAASLGKAAVVGGYRLEELKKFVPCGMYPTAIICEPETVRSAIAGLAADRVRAQQFGQDAQAFVQNNWNSTQVAGRFLRIIDDLIPDDWYLDPSEVIYVEGGGQSRGKTRERIRSLVDNFGADALCVSHRPELLDALLNFAYDGD